MGYKQPSSGLPFKEIGSSPAKQKAADGQDYSDKRYDYKSTDFLKTDYASGHGAGDLTTIKRLNKQNQEKGKDYKDHGDWKSGENKNYLAKKGKLKKVTKKAPTLGPKKLPVNEGEPKRAVHHRAEPSPTPYASPAKQAEKKSNISSTKGSSVITNTDTGDTYDLKTGETVKNKKGAEKKKRKEAVKKRKEASKQKPR